MTTSAQIDMILRQQIAQQLAALYPTAPIEARIAKALLENGRFEDDLTADELEIIMRNIVYTLIAEQKVAGFDVDVVHNVQSTQIEIENEEAAVSCIVHIHKPIVAFIHFNYVLENDPTDADSIRLKKGTLKVDEKTRRFDIKAKAALAALNVRKITMHEMQQMARIIERTLPPQLLAQGVSGEFSHVQLVLNDKTLNVSLEGTFQPID